MVINLIAEKAVEKESGKEVVDNMVEVGRQNNVAFSMQLQVGEWLPNPRSRVERIPSPHVPGAMRYRGI